MDSGFRVLDYSLSQRNLDSRFHSLVGYLSSILDSKALDSGFHKHNFPRFRILQAKIIQIVQSGYPHTGRSTSQAFSDQFMHISLSSGKFNFLLTFDFII